MGPLGNPYSEEVFFGVVDSQSGNIRKYILKNAKARQIKKILEVLEESKKGKTLDELFYFAYDCFHEGDVQAIQADLKSIQETLSQSPEPRTLTAEQEHSVKKMLIDHRRARENKEFNALGITTVKLTWTSEGAASYPLYKFEYDDSNRMEFNSCVLTVEKRKVKKNSFFQRVPEKDDAQEVVISLTNSFKRNQFKGQAVRDFDRSGLAQITTPQSPFIAVELNDRFGAQYTLIFVGMEAADIATLSDAIQSSTARTHVFAYFRQAFPDKTSVSIRPVDT